MEDILKLISDGVRKFKGRIAAFALSFAVGLALAVLFKFAVLPLIHRAETRAPAAVPTMTNCERGETFDSPEEVTAALTSDDVGVRREMFRRLSVLPGLTTAYYDFERDRDFPERAESVKLLRVNLDEEPDEEALVTFVRVDSPVAVVLKQGACGWKPVAAVSSWLRFEDYPYADWLETPDATATGRRLLLVRDSTGDAVRYTRRARLLSLACGRLEQVAEVEEETIEPIAGYAGADWSEVKRRRTASIEFVPPSEGTPARMRVVRREEVLKYAGAEPLNLYWREGDGVWHQAPRHWRTRRSEVLEPASVSEEQFVWSEQKGRFVNAGS
ncbi:MAG TPA: hypothetical protein VJ866_09405 [Pyrinomonadaceae bacterium]|nr:hypothetical protein [Pyrinomonadaceae bacterium]